MKISWRKRFLFTLLSVLVLSNICTLHASSRRKVIIDQDTNGPATSDLQGVALLLQAPDVDVLGITITSGDAWRDEEVAHALRLLEVMGRTEVPVVPGAVYPLMHTLAESRNWEKCYGRCYWLGAWTQRPPRAGESCSFHEANVIPPLPEGAPQIKPLNEPAAYFLIKKVRENPGQISLIAAGPMTNIALAIRMDPEFPKLVKELIFMGGSFRPPLDVLVSEDFANSPRHEFNFWWDPEAARIVLRSHWNKVTCVPTDITLKTRYTKDLAAEITKVKTPLTDYLAKYGLPNWPMWDELAVAAWIDPSLITETGKVYMDVNCDHGAGYGDTLSWKEGGQPEEGEQLVEVCKDLDLKRFNQFFVESMQKSNNSKVLASE